MDGIYIIKDVDGNTEYIELRGCIEEEKNTAKYRIYYIYPDTINTVSDVEKLIDEYEDSMYYSPVYVECDLGDMSATFFIGHCIEYEMPEGGTIDSISEEELFDYIKNRYTVDCENIELKREEEE